MSHTTETAILAAGCFWPTPMPQDLAKQGNDED